MFFRVAIVIHGINNAQQAQFQFDDGACLPVNILLNSLNNRR
jgi:hypothetical protein